MIVYHYNIFVEFYIRVNYQSIENRNLFYMNSFFIYVHCFILFVQFLISRHLISRTFSFLLFSVSSFLYLANEFKDIRGSTSESMFSMWMAAEIDPRASTFWSRDSQAKSYTLTLVEREQTCASCFVCVTNRAYQEREKRGFAVVYKQSLSDVALV